MQTSPRSRASGGDDEPIAWLGADAREVEGKSSEAEADVVTSRADARLVLRALREVGDPVLAVARGANRLALYAWGDLWVTHWAWANDEEWAVWGDRAAAERCLDDAHETFDAFLEHDEQCCFGDYGCPRFFEGAAAGQPSE